MTLLTLQYIVSLGLLLTFIKLATHPKEYFFLTLVVDACIYIGLAFFGAFFGWLFEADARSWSFIAMSFWAIPVCLFRAAKIFGVIADKLLPGDS